jgi:glycosyltransferase involved in cell wall biosynthesis
MRVLIVSTAFPFPPRWGFGMRVYQLARQLAAHHDVTLLSYGDADDERNAERVREELDVELVSRPSGSRLAKRGGQALSLLSRRGFHAHVANSRELQEAVDRLSAGGAFDIFQLESSLLGGLRFPVESRVVLDEHNIEYEVFQRMEEGERSRVRRAFYRIEHARFRRFEEQVWRDVAGCVLTSDREEPVVRLAAPGTPTRVVPNGVDLDYFRPADAPFEQNTLVFNGVLDYRPNLDAATHLVEEIWPEVRDRVPGARLKIVGRAGRENVERLRQPGVELTGEVPDVRQYLQGAAVVAVPILMGGGTRFKVLEGLAMEKPIVSTTLGAEGLGTVHGEHLMLADDPELFASTVVALFEDPAHGQGLGRAGRKLVEERYSWVTAGERLNDFLIEVCA